MKNIIFILPVFAFLNLNATNTSSLKSSLEKELKVVDLKGLELDQNQPNFVNVELSVEAGNLKIKDIDGSSEALKSVVTDELKSLQFDPECCEGESYLYQIRFERR